MNKANLLLKQNGQKVMGELPFQVIQTKIISKSRGKHLNRNTRRILLQRKAESQVKKELTIITITEMLTTPHS